MKKYGSVYFIKHKGLNPVKIGYSSHPNPLKRIESYNTSSPYGVEVLGYIISDNSKKLEGKLHKKYQEKRLNGEWFDISIKDVQNELLIHGESDLHQQMNDFFRKKMEYVLLSGSEIFEEPKIDLDVLKPDFVIYFNKLLENSNNLLFDYNKEYLTAINEYSKISKREFNKIIKQVSNNNGFQVKSIVKNGLRMYKIFKKNKV